MTRPRAADDFAVIRARVEELRRERATAEAEQRRVTIFRSKDVTGGSAITKDVAKVPLYIRRLMKARDLC